MKLKNVLMPLILSLILVAYTAYVLLDTFVIAREYEPIYVPDSTLFPLKTQQPEPEEESPESNIELPTAPEGADTGPEVPSGTATEETVPEETEPMKPIVTANSYQDSNISITISEIRAYNSTIYVADIKLSSAEYLKTALAQDKFGRNITEKTSAMASRNNAILAINGDYYGARSNGYIARNGIFYRDSRDGRDCLIIYSNGNFEIINELDISPRELINRKPLHVLSFGPQLVSGGSVNITPNYDSFVSHSKNPRTAIAILGELHYAFVVCDGRTSQSAGLTMKELANVMVDLGAIVAYNLDGGGSATMWFNGHVVNRPTQDGKNFVERGISDIVYIGY